jgi:hypothetical protein
MWKRDKQQEMEEISSIAGYSDAGPQTILGIGNWKEGGGGGRRGEGTLNAVKMKKNLHNQIINHNTGYLVPYFLQTKG